MLAIATAICHARYGWQGQAHTAADFSKHAVTLLPASQLLSRLVKVAVSRLSVEGSNIVTSKIQVLVRIDRDSARVRVQVRGVVTGRNVQALYVVARRANSLMPTLALILDVSHARVAGDALEELHSCSKQGHLPMRIDPLQSDCRISVLYPYELQLQAA